MSILCKTYRFYFSDFKSCHFCIREYILLSLISKIVKCLTKLPIIHDKSYFHLKFLWSASF